MPLLISTQKIATQKFLCPVSVRSLAPRDEAAFDCLFARNPARYRSARMNIEATGFSSEKVKHWGAFAEDGETLCGLLTRFGNTLVAVDDDGDCASLFALIADNERGLAGMRGSAALVDRIGQRTLRYAPREREESHYLQLETPVNATCNRLNMARRATLADVDALAALYDKAGSMYRSRANVLAKLTHDRVFIAERYDVKSGLTKVVSCALTNVEGTEAGVIGGVFTLPEMRGKGYAEAVTAALAQDLQRDGKTPCLYYENPIAGMVYRKLGFVKRDEWAVMFFRVVNPPRRVSP